MANKEKSLEEMMANALKENAKAIVKVKNTIPNRKNQTENVSEKKTTKVDKKNEKKEKQETSKHKEEKKKEVKESKISSRNKKVIINFDESEFRKHVTEHKDNNDDEDLIYRICFKPYYKGGKKTMRGRQESLIDAFFRVLKSNPKKFIKKITKEDVI